MIRIYLTASFDICVILQWITYLEHTPDRESANAAKTKLDIWLGSSGVIERDPYAGGYVQKVLDWAPIRESYAKQFVSDADLETHLRILVEQQQEDGGWMINFPAVSSGGEAEWRGALTVDRLRTLRSYGII